MAWQMIRLKVFLSLLKDFFDLSKANAENMQLLFPAINMRKEEKMFKQKDNVSINCN